MMCWLGAPILGAGDNEETSLMVKVQHGKGLDQGSFQDGDKGINARDI